jgi:hypothetical protein
MAYPKSGGPWPSRLSSSLTAKIAFLSVALAVLGTGIALLSLPTTHQAINRAEKADALKSFTEFKTKQGLNRAWYRFFREHQLADPQASNQFVGVATTRGVRPARVAVNDRTYMAW